MFKKFIHVIARGINHFIPFYVCTIFWCVNRPRFVEPFISRWPLGLFPPFGCSKSAAPQVSYTCTCTCLSICSQLCGGAHLAVDLLGHVVIQCVILEGGSCHSPVEPALTSLIHSNVPTLAAVAVTAPTSPMMSVGVCVVLPYYIPSCD